VKAVAGSIFDIAGEPPVADQGRFHKYLDWKWAYTAFLFQLLK